MLFFYFYYLCAKPNNYSMKKFVSTLLLSALCTSFAMAWGGFGHSAIAYIAERHLTAKAKANIERYIDGRSIVYYAAWMDYNRQTPPLDITRDWHVDYWTDDMRTDADGKPQPPCNASQIDRIVKEMSDFRELSDSLVDINIRFLTHLVGDLHCPVHIDFPLSRPMQVTVEGKPLRVHKMWDGYAISNRHLGCSPMQLAEILDIYTPQMIHQAQQGDPYSWFNETVAAAQHALDMIPEDKILTDENYFDEAAVIAEDRITVAGYRLAAILNSIFDK